MTLRTHENYEHLIDHSNHRYDLLVNLQISLDQYTRKLHGHRLFSGPPCGVPNSTEAPSRSGSGLSVPINDLYLHCDLAEYPCFRRGVPIRSLLVLSDWNFMPGRLNT